VYSAIKATDEGIWLKCLEESALGESEQRRRAEICGAAEERAELDAAVLTTPLRTFTRVF